MWADILKHPILPVFRLFLHQGRIEEAGSASQVFENPGSERCRQFVNAQFCRA